MKFLCFLVCLLASVGRYVNGEYDIITLCPDDYVPRNGCVTPDQLVSDHLIKSNTTFKFVPAFKMKPNQVIRFENVSNILLDTAGPVRANVSCVQENSFIFQNVKFLTIRNVQFNECGTNTSGAVCLVNCCNVTVLNVSFSHGTSGIFATNLSGIFAVSSAEFRYIQGPSIRVYYGRYLQLVTVTHSTFEHNYFRNRFRTKFAPYSAFAVDVQNTSSSVVISDVLITNNTHGSDTSGILISVAPDMIILERCFYLHNEVFTDDISRPPYADIQFFFIPFSAGRRLIKIIDSHFDFNVFRDDTGTIDKTVDSGHYVLDFLSSANYYSVSMGNNSISGNSGHYEGAIFSDFTHVEMTNHIIANNSFFPSVFYVKSAVSFSNSNRMIINNCSIVNNSMTGLDMQSSSTSFIGNIEFRGNRGYNGGGMAVYDNSFLDFVNATVVFEDNCAQNLGGGLYVKTEQKLLFRFIQTSLKFGNNSAMTAGGDVYGIDLYRHQDQATAFTSALAGNRSIDLTSDPRRVCDCSAPTCLANYIPQTISTVQTYPGRLFNLSLLAVGSLLNDSTILSGVPSVVFAQLLPLHSDPGIIPSEMLAQKTNRTCSRLQYKVSSTKSNEVMVLSVENSINKIPQNFTSMWYQNDTVWKQLVESLLLSRYLTVPAYVSVELLPCPVGFQLLSGECKCATFLTDLVVHCSIDSKLIQPQPSVWILNTSESLQRDSNHSFIYFAHRHCPYDFCNSSDGFEFSLEEPDAQCRHNRAGILCGQCKHGYSLTLGSLECKQCSNIYLLLLIPFAFAGILLILFLSLTDMTVAAGTINGLLFYANIVWENKATFFPPEASGGFLTVFIAWLNLDLGISTCFYDGLDSYVYTWLQFSFPIFIWFLAFSIILASRRLDFMNKICGRNIVQVLATLFLLSYTKLQRTITTSLSFTAISVSNGGKFYSWLLDGNILYLQGKHIALFLVSILFLLILFVPYTLSIALGPWLQTKTQYRVFRWVLELKPFFDAYFGPLKDKHRYWTGLLLLSRMIHTLVAAVNILGDDSVNLLAVISLSLLLISVLWQPGGIYKLPGSVYKPQPGGVYKSLAFSLLDSFFLINLGILSASTLYIKASSGSQYASVYVSTGLSFAVFCLILLSHCFVRISSLSPFSKAYKRLHSLLVIQAFRKFVMEPLFYEHAESAEEMATDGEDEAMLDCIDQDRTPDPEARLSAHSISTRDTY